MGTGSRVGGEIADRWLGWGEKKNKRGKERKWKKKGKRISDWNESLENKIKQVQFPRKIHKGCLGHKEVE